MDTRDAQPLYRQVLSFYRNMGMPHPEEPPFMLVDAFTLNDYSNREGKDVSGGPVFHVRGLTLATVYRSIPSIVRAVGGHGGLGVSSVATALPGAERVMCDVSAILVLYGLPRLLTGKHQSEGTWPSMWPACLGMCTFLVLLQLTCTWISPCVCYYCMICMRPH